MLPMRQQRVWLGGIVLDREPPIDLHVDLPGEAVVKKAAYLKDRLAFLLDTKFRPSPPEPAHLTVEQVAEMLNCRCRTVQRMIERGDLHPMEQNGELYLDRTEVEAIRHVPITERISRLIPRL
jgi:excisionase family DNA binding protein